MEWLAGLLCEQTEQLGGVHVVQGVEIDAEGVGDTRHIQTERLQQLDEVHLFACEWVVQLGTTPVALGPRAPFHQMQMTGVRVLVMVVVMIVVFVVRWISICIWKWSLSLATFLLSGLVDIRSITNHMVVVVIVIVSPT